jgi:phage protein U
MAYFDSEAPEPVEEGDGEALSSRKKGKGMSKAELANVLSAEIEAAKKSDRVTYAKDRQRALQYYQGEMPDTSPPANRSKAMSRDVADTVDWMLPGLMRIFFAGDKIVDYQPAEPGDEDFAEQATEYVNFLIMSRLDGYEVFWDAFWDALVMRIGVIKFYWDDTPEYKTESFTGLSDDALALVMAKGEYGDEPEVLEQETEQYIDAQTGEMVATHDLKVRCIKRKGAIKIESVPPEEFLIDNNAASLDDARFVCHRTTKTRSDLIREGFPRKKIEDLPTHHKEDDTEEASARQDEFVHDDNAVRDPTTEEIEVCECYAAVDMDGDGIAEWTRTLLAGGYSEENILAHEEWGDPIPFADLVPARIPHRWQGRSIADQTMDVQQIKTVLLRNALDNLYENTNRQRVVVESQILNMDEVVSPNFGGIIRTKSLDAVRWDQPAFLAPEVFQMLSFMDDIIEKRTGVSRATAALDPEALQNQTATATQLGADNRYSKIELVARNFAEGGLKRLFSGLLQLVVMHQDRPEMIRLRDEFVSMDPRGWNADMDVTVNIGLGAGSRDRDLTVLNNILGYQREVVAAMGPANPFVTPKQLFNTLDKIVATAGLKNTEQFFTEITDEQVAAYAAQQQGGQQDPKAQAEMAKAQGEMQLAQMKAQAEMGMAKEKVSADMQIAQGKVAMDMQMAQAKAQMDAQIARERGQAELQLRREEFAAEIAMKRDEMNARIEIEREKAAMQHEARMAEMAQEADLKRMQLAIPVNLPGDETNVARKPQ